MTTFVAGPGLDDPTALLRWLDGLPGGTMLRLPIAMERSPDGLAAVGRAWVGATTADPGGRTLEVRLDATTLGMTLADHLAPHWPAGAARVVLLVRGFWGPPIPLPYDHGPTLTVRAIDGSAAGVTHAQQRL